MSNMFTLLNAGGETKMNVYIPVLKALSIR